METLQYQLERRMIWNRREKKNHIIIDWSNKRVEKRLFDMNVALIVRSFFFQHKCKKNYIYIEVYPLICEVVHTFTKSKITIQYFFLYSALFEFPIAGHVPVTVIFFFNSFCSLHQNLFAMLWCYTVRAAGSHCEQHSSALFSL